MKYITQLWQWIKAYGTPYPRRDWLTVLVVCGIAVLVLAGVAAYMFFGIRSGALIAASVPNSPVSLPIVSRELMTKTLEMYEVRATNYNAKNFPTYTLFDPHLIIVKK